MRFLFIDANYPTFLDKIYTDAPGLASTTYGEQMARIKDGLFGEAHFQAAALIALGHEAEVIVTNADPAQRAWALEHGLDPANPARREFRWRRGVVPWWSTRSDGVNWNTVLAQARAFQPDVLYVEIMDTIPASAVRQLRRYSRLTVAQIATDLPTDADRDYDLVLSSIPRMVEGFRAAGVASEWVPLAFEPAVLDTIAPVARSVPVSFVGSFSSVYADRAEVMEEVARVAELQTWTGSADQLAAGSLVRQTVRGSAFGREMYEILARSSITVNSHRILSGPDANNLRLFEATGMGALLVTDARHNLGQLFEVDREIVTYRDPTDAGRVVRHYLDHPDEVSRIAKAGQDRTLREHTWIKRMARTIELVQARL